MPTSFSQGSLPDHRIVSHRSSRDPCHQSDGPMPCSCSVIVSEVEIQTIPNTSNEFQIARTIARTTEVALNERDRLDLVASRPEGKWTVPGKITDVVVAEVEGEPSSNLWNNQL